MYRYDTATKRMICVSCIPGGGSPQTDVQGSQDGRFMTDDGRVFFGTEDPLVNGDTNKAFDVYEYAGGRPQLITPGTGETRQPPSNSFTSGSPGLVGVSANGADVYFSTFDTLVPEDHNGLFLKFYDARSGGGFAAPAPPNECEAADECHGPSSQPPNQIVDGAGAELVGGEPRAKGPHRHHRRRHHKRHQRRHRRGSEAVHGVGGAGR
jgi:hypothetical protein